MIMNESVVLISSTDPVNQSFGTGFVIYQEEESTYVLTCAHVIRDIGGPEHIHVDHIPARLVALDTDEGFDLAVLQVEGLRELPPLPLRILGERARPIRVTGFGVFDKKSERFAVRPL